MFNNNSISISVSDDEPDELGRMRVRVRRKRKKPGHRLKNEFLHRVVRKLVRYWALLIFLPALGLLLYEASRIGRKPSSVANTELGASEKSTLVDSELSNVTNPSLEKKSDGNLNRLDATTRVVGGVRQRKSSVFCFFNYIRFSIVRCLNEIVLRTSKEFF